MSAKKFDGFGNFLGFHSSPSKIVNYYSNGSFGFAGLNFFIIQTTYPDFKFNFQFTIKGDVDNFSVFSPTSTGYLFLAFNKNLFKDLLNWRISFDNEFRDETEDDQGKRLDKIVILNGKMGLKVKDLFIFYALENITNQTYRTFGDFNMPKRNYFWGVSWEFRD